MSGLLCHRCNNDNIGETFNFECAIDAAGDNKSINMGAAVGTVPMRDYD